MIQGPGRTAESQRAFESDMADLTKLWKEHGRSGKPYIMAGARGHLTTDRKQVGQDVVKGITPETLPSTGIGTSGRVQEGEERAYVSTYPVTYVSQMVEDLHRLESAGVDMVIVWLPSYRYGGLDNMGVQLQQMEIFAEHVLPKVHRDKKPIEMDFDGKLCTPMVTQ